MTMGADVPSLAEHGVDGGAHDSPTDNALGCGDDLDLGEAVEQYDRMERGRTLRPVESEAENGRDGDGDGGVPDTPGKPPPAE
jgi:hypothetical protein